tara:strand:+ start:42 stop:1175 length:1134 start_codon:yes stop_codon:yes gene_type:complete
MVALTPAALLAEMQRQHAAQLVLKPSSAPSPPANRIHYERLRALLAQAAVADADRPPAELAESAELADWVDTAESADNAVPVDFNADDNADATAVDPDSPRQTPRRSDARFDDVSKMGPMYVRAVTDGQLLEGGVERLVSALSLTTDSVFADLGSGNGAALIHLAARVTCRGCWGIELLRARDAIARRSLESATDAGLLKSPVVFERGDLSSLAQLARQESRNGPTADAKQTAELQKGAQRAAAQEATAEPFTFEPFRLKELTHAFSSSVCFDDVLLREMATTLGNANLFPRFQTLVSLRALPSQASLIHVGELFLETSWNQNCRGHVYVPADILERGAGAIGTAPLLARLLCSEGACTLPTALQWPAQGVIKLPRS